jgi:hypothetical protein
MLPNTRAAASAYAHPVPDIDPPVRVVFYLPIPRHNVIAYIPEMTVVERGVMYAEPIRYFDSPPDLSVLYRSEDVVVVTSDRGPTFEGTFGVEDQLGSTFKYAGKGPPPPPAAVRPSKDHRFNIFGFTRQDSINGSLGMFTIDSDDAEALAEDGV